MKQLSFWDTGLGFTIGAVLIFGGIPVAIVLAGMGIFSLPEAPQHVILIIIGAVITLALLMIFPGSYIDEMLYKRRKVREHHEAEIVAQAFQERLRQERMAANGGHDIQITGSPAFKRITIQLLDELRAKLPTRYPEILSSMPWVQEVESYSLGPGVAGRSSGKFVRDVAMGEYTHFRNIYLHEAGHNIAGKGWGDWTEDAARWYSWTVQTELGLEPCVW